MNFIQEVLNLLDRKQDKKELKLTKDWFEFGRQKPSSVGNPLYSPKMTPHAIRFDDLKCEIISGLVGGTGTEHTLPMWSTVDANNCDIQTLIDSVFSQSTDATLGVVSANLLVKGNTEIDGDLLVHGTQTIIESTIVEIADNIIFLNTQGANVDAGFEVGTVDGKKLWGWDAAQKLWSTFGENIRTEDIFINGAIHQDGESLVNVVNEAEGLASQDNDNSLATVAAIIDWSDQMDLDVIADSGAPLDILLNSEALHIVGGSNINTDTDGQEKVIINLDDDIVVNSVTSKFLTLAGDPGPYTVTSIVNDYNAVVDPNLTLLTAKAIFSYVDDQRDYVQNVALNGASLDFNSVGNAFGGSVDVSALLNKKYTIEPTNSTGSFGIISLLEDGVVDSGFKVVGDNQWINVSSNGAEIEIRHTELTTVPITNQAVTLGTGDTFTTFEYVFDNAGHVVSKEEVDYTLNITGGGSETLTTLTYVGDSASGTDELTYTDENGNTHVINGLGQQVLDLQGSDLSIVGADGVTTNTVDLSALGGGGGMALSDIVAGDKINVSINGAQQTVTVSHQTTATTPTTSSTILSHNGTFDAIVDVTHDAYGHITGYETKTFTMPAGGTGADGNDFVSNVTFDSNTSVLDFTGTGGAFNGSINLAALASTETLTSLQKTGDLLIYTDENGNGNSIDLSAYKNADQNLWANIAVSGQPTITANTLTDTLEFVAGTGIQIQTNATQKKVVISATGGGTTDGVVTDVAVNGLDLDFTGSNGGFNGTIPILDIAPVQQVLGDGQALSSSYDTQTGVTTISPIVNNEPTQNSQALVLSGGIWSYIDSLTYPNDFVNNVQLNSAANTLDFSGTGGAFNGSVSLAGYANQNSFETIKITNPAPFPGQSPVIADSVTDVATFNAGRGISITSDAAADEITWSTRLSLVGGLEFDSSDEISLKTISPTGSSSAQTIKDKDTFQVPTVTFDKFGRAASIDTKTITLDAPGGSGTDTCAYGLTGNGLYTLTPNYSPLVFSGSAIGLKNISGATGNYVITYTLQFSPSGNTGFKSYDTKLVAQTQASGSIDLIEFSDTVYAASDAKFTKTFTYTAVNISDQDSIEIHIKGDITLRVEKVAFSAVATDCEAINSGKAETLISR